MSDLPTFDGSEPGPTHGHVGWPIKWGDIADRITRGLPVYVPTDPRSIDQAPYIAFSEKRGPNSD